MQIRTQRLNLRPLDHSDAAAMSLLAGDFDVACMTGTIPHPYSETAARAWVDRVGQGEEGVVFAVTRDGRLIGCSGYMPMDADHAELGYWIGKPYWGAGYATEAVRAVIAHAFDTHGFTYIRAGHFVDNSGSQRVLGKLGFTSEGEETRDCVARGEQVACLTYRLERARAATALQHP
ncbi:GNAT family N-acetyltransferase [Methyloceanibacter caenitepidi]|uniref:50S ribosomal protein acetyltransferase n=1 Tax=Methyloceanibacter caenitepidi TaxID=1384459 RepID=A0A0A8K0S0_9HYPH|nr:GNAT family N-acetyltransferase [Methyloceanibacter caenitepidi]BAQ15599.1 50S ribosomal protein acetyltransferase [Methyloceanibacter caenitepidi]